MTFMCTIFFILIIFINFISSFITQYDPNEADLLGRISSAVSSKYYYDCMINDEILKNNTELIYSYNEHNSKLNGDFLAGIIKLKNDPESIVIVHKSTSSIKQLISQVYLYPMEALNITYNVISTELKKLLNNGNYKNVIFTGHSLGGGLAILDSYRCVYENICNSNTTKVITFGGPRIGNCEFVQNYNKMVPYTYRVVVKDDLIPTIPSCDTSFWENSCRDCDKSWFDLYYHVGTEIYYANDTSGDYKICQQYTEDIKCSSKVFSWLNIPKYLINNEYYLNKHVTYFETIYNQTYNETKCDFYIN